MSLPSKTVTEVNDICARSVARTAPVVVDVSPIKRSSSCPRPAKLPLVPQLDDCKSEIETITTAIHEDEIQKFHELKFALRDNNGVIQPRSTHYAQEEKDGFIQTPEIINNWDSNGNYDLTKLPPDLAKKRVRDFTDALINGDDVTVPESVESDVSDLDPTPDSERSQQLDFLCQDLQFEVDSKATEEFIESMDDAPNVSFMQRMKANAGNAAFSIKEFVKKYVKLSADELQKMKKYTKILDTLENLFFFLLSLL